MSEKTGRSESSVDPTQGERAFCRWFSNSKVVDGRGQPLVVYHGTPNNFADFQVGPSGVHFGTLDQASHMLSIRVAKLPPAEFANLPLLPGGQSGYIKAAYLSIQNPKRVEDPRDDAGWAREIELAKSEGHDGLVYKNAWEGPHEDASWIVFDAAQIRTTNTATWCSQRYAQRNFLLTDLQAALSKKVEEAKAQSLGAAELRLANDGRAWLCVSVIQQDGSASVISIDL